MRRFCLSLAVASSALVPLAHAIDVPVNDGFMTDAAGILTSDEEKSIEMLLTEERAKTSNEIAVVIIQSLDGDVIADAAVEIGRKWGVGSSKNNGILILISYEDREMFIATGYGLEGAVPDIVAKGIIDEDMVPQFRDGKYAEGITDAIITLQKHIAGEYTADRYTQIDEESPWFFLVVLFFVILQWLAAIMARTKSWWLGGVVGGGFGIVLTVLAGWWIAIPVLIVLGSAFDFIVSRAYSARGKTPWWAGGHWGPGGGGSFGGGSSGGFGGFGGGSFGGGGAGGKW
jgi:uncharacterized protein